jgi:hypothetical protein
MDFKTFMRLFYILMIITTINVNILMIRNILL